MMISGDCRLRRAVASAALAILMMTAAAGAVEKESQTRRFATLRSDKVNVRTGPGDQYPIDWVFTHKELPVEIVAEFEHWRKIRDSQGAEGWVHQRMVTGKRAVLIQGDVRELHRDAKPDSDVVARAEPGVIAKLLECQGVWCRVETSGIKGWLRRGEVWGVYPDETVQ
jgi:SH3-like domain-containing protein